MRAGMFYNRTMPTAIPATLDNNAVRLPPPANEMPPANGKNGDMLKWLNGLGRLPKNFDGAVLAEMMENKNAKLRQLAVANLGKLSDIRFLPPLLQTATKDDNTAVRREAAAAIGRMRNKAAVSALVRLTHDKDPKVVLQALRGLLVFGKNKTTHAVLQRLAKHPNELIQDVIAYEKNYVFDTAESKKAQVESPDYLKNLIVHGDAISILKRTPPESVHLTFTSPPYYNARDYSIYSSYAEYLAFLKKAFRQVLRVTKPGRFLVVNTSPVIMPRLGRQFSSKRYPIPFDLHALLAAMEWEFIDDIVWAKPEASVKNRNGGFFQHRKPLAYKPNARTEYLMVYRKKTPRLIDWNIQQYDRRRLARSFVKGDYDTSNVWNVEPTFDKKHSAVFPSALCQRVIRYYSFADDLVFDPFGGSGTLGRTAAAMGRFFFMTEAAGEYVECMRETFGKTPDMFLPSPRFVGEVEYAALKRRG